MTLEPLRTLVRRRRWLAAAALSGLLAACARIPGAAPSGDPLPSWNEGANKQRIVDFALAVNTEGGKDFVPPEQRIAVFDDDGTLSLEYPMYTQLVIVLDRIKATAPQHPEWKDKEPYKSVIGSRQKLAFEVKGKGTEVALLPQLDFNNDKSGKPLSVEAFIGRRPIAAFGNSDGDFRMLQWTTTAPGLRLGMLVHHDDAGREYAYDCNSGVGRLAEGLDQYPAMGWSLIRMKNDWKPVFPSLN